MTKVSCGAERFLKKQNNKKQLINLLSLRFRSSGIIAVECLGDADVIIVKKAIEFSSAGGGVVVATDDTDILILLVYHWNKSKEKKTTTKLLKWWSLETLIKSSIPHREYILFAHAWGGCYTTSAIFKQGKIKILTTLLKDDLVQSKATIFGNLHCTQGDIGKAGNEIFIKAYKGIIYVHICKSCNPTSN